MYSVYDYFILYMYNMYSVFGIYYLDFLINFKSCDIFFFRFFGKLY